jgi:kynureninase
VGFENRALITRGDCEKLDAADTLLPFREKFLLPENVIYLDGNSLGALPKATPARMREVVEREWGEQLIRSWNTAGWVDAAQRVGDKIGRLIGADPGETLAADSTSINLFKVLAAALSLRPSRTKILSEADNFPTDLYIAGGLTGFLGGLHRLHAMPTEMVEAAIDNDTAVVMLTHVNYRTGRRWDMRRVTEIAHARGAVMVWDLAHSAGAMTLSLSRDGVDFAVGCGYKYLNGGPGAPGFLYIARRHQTRVVPPLSGWFGHAAPFDFNPRYEPAPGIARAAVGTPPILGLAALESGVDLHLLAPLETIREKSIAQTDLFMALSEQELAQHGFVIVTPSQPEDRGSQVCLRHRDAWPIMQALIANRVIGDFRAPDILRFGFAPLYNSYKEIWNAIATLRRIMDENIWREPGYQARAKVT